MQSEVNAIRPQPGPQEMFLASSADIAIYGGSAGAGKTFGILMECLRHIDNSDFGATIFRRTTPQITNEGALWDESMKLYSRVPGAVPKIGELSWRFPSGAAVSFSHLEHEKTVFNYQGAQIPLIIFDEVTHFTESQFWYMLSRNRSMCGVKPYIRATCNPDPDSFIAQLISWWIDQETGFPIPCRSGVLRYFVREGDALHWADTPEELAEFKNPFTGEPIPPKSLTFISAKITDNPALLAADPGYVANLMALPHVEQARLLGGNWKIKPAGMLIRADWFLRYTDVPPLLYRCIVADTAQKTAVRNDYSVLAHVGYRADNGNAVILDVLRGKWESHQLRTHAREFWNKAKALNGQPGKGTLRDMSVEDKVSGTGLIQELRAGDKRNGIPPIPVIPIPRAIDKLTRVLDAAPKVQVGRVEIPHDKLSVAWVKPFLDECESFRADDTHPFDDQVDVLCDLVKKIDAGIDVYSNL